MNLCAPPKIGKEQAAAGSLTIERLVIINDDCVNSGGAAQIALLSARLMRERGVAVTFLTGDDGDNDELRALGVDVLALGGRHILDGNRLQAAARGLYSGAARAFVADWIRRNDTPNTAYHLHNWHKTLSAAAFPPLKQVADRLFVSTHDFFIACPNGGYYDYQAKRGCELRPMGGRCLLSHCDKRRRAHKIWRLARHALLASLFSFRDARATVLAVHEGMIPFLERGGVPREAVRVLRNPVRRWLDGRVEAERNRDILFVGRLEADKGVDLLCAAAAMLKTPLQVVGDGPLRAGLQQKYPEAAFHGRLERAQIAELAQRARLLAVPTRGRETFGLVAFEALMSGLPVVLSQYALAVDEIVEREIGLSCNPQTPQSLLAPLQRLLQNDALAARMSKKAHQQAQSLAPTPEQWGRSLMELYADAIEVAASSRR